MSRAILVVAGILLTGQVLWAGTIKRIAVVRVDQHNVYESVYKAFAEEIRRDIKLIDVKETDPYRIVRSVREIRPDLILAIGGVSLDNVLEIDDIPIVYASPMFPQNIPLGQTNVSGVRMNIAPEKIIEMIAQALPEMKNIRIFFTAKWTRDLANLAQIAGRTHGLNIVTQQVSSQEEYMAALQCFREDNTHGFLMFPDFPVLTVNSMESLFRFSDENRVPVITFSKKYMSKGALLSIGVDFPEIGRQTWKLADTILRGDSDGQPVHVFANKPHVMLNFDAARKFRARVNASAIHIDTFFGKEDENVLAN